MAYRYPAMPADDGARSSLNSPPPPFVQPAPAVPGFHPGAPAGYQPAHAAAAPYGTPAGYGAPAMPGAGAGGMPYGAAPGGAGFAPRAAAPAGVFPAAPAGGFAPAPVGAVGAAPFAPAGASSQFGAPAGAGRGMPVAGGAAPFAPAGAPAAFGARPGGFPGAPAGAPAPAAAGNSAIFGAPAQAPAPAVGAGAGFAPGVFPGAPGAAAGAPATAGRAPMPSYAAPKTGGYAYPAPPTGNTPTAAAAPTGAFGFANGAGAGMPPAPTAGAGAPAMPPPPVGGAHSFSAPATGYAYPKTGPATGAAPAMPQVPSAAPAANGGAPAPYVPAGLQGYKPMPPAGGPAAAAAAKPAAPAPDAYAGYQFPQAYKTVASAMPPMPAPGAGAAAAAGRGMPMPPPGGQGMPAPPPPKKLYYNPEDGGYSDESSAQQQQRSFDGGGADYNPNAAVPQSPSGARNQLLSTSACAVRRPNVPPYVRPCHPAYIQMVCNAVPSSATLRLRTAVPFGLVAQPFANTPAGEPDLPVVNFGATGVMRCARKECRAYINPYVTFLNNGQLWRCNCCQRDNEVPSSYYAPLTQQGIRADLGSRPELMHSSFEITAPVEYMVRPPMPPSYLFLIDVSTAAVRSGVLRSVSQTILSTLSQLPGAGRTRIAFVTFNSAVHVYQFKPTSPAPTMYVLPDLDDIFMPVPNDLLVSLDDCKPQVEAFLESLAHVHDRTDDVECAFGPALDAALQVMGRIGGKLVTFLSGLPSLGAGRLQNRENPRALGTPKEHEGLLAATDFYKKRAVKFTRYQIGVDMFLFAAAAHAHSMGSGAFAQQQQQQQVAEFIDVATVVQLAKFTGGQLYYYPGFTDARGHAKLHADLTRNLTRNTGWESVVRIRVSAGVKLKTFYGNFYLRGEQLDLLALPVIDSDKAFAIDLVNDDVQASSICIQAALLYTTSTGERRIRVHTISLPVVASALEIFPSLSVTAAINVMAKQASELVTTQSFEKAREFLRHKAFTVIRAFRQSGYNSLRFQSAQEQQAAGQAVQTAASTMEVLALLTLALVKSLAFREAADVRTDARAAALADLSTMGLTELETFIRPRLLPLHDLQGNQGVFDAKQTGANPAHVELPVELPLSAEQLRADGLYLCDNGFSMFLRVGKALPQHVVGALLEQRTPVPLASKHADKQDVKAGSAAAGAGAGAAAGAGAGATPTPTSPFASPFANAGAKPAGAAGAAAAAAAADKPVWVLRTPTAADEQSRSHLWRVHNIVNALRAQSTRYADVVVLREGDPATAGGAEQKLFALLIEDRGPNNAFSLAEFNQQINKAIAQSN